MVLTDGDAAENLLVSGPGKERVDREMAHHEAVQLYEWLLTNLARLWPGFLSWRNHSRNGHSVV